jgi:hypothetical protein
MSEDFRRVSPSVVHLGSADAGVSRPRVWIHAVALSIAFLLLATAALKAGSPREAVALEAAYEIPFWLSAVVIQIELLIACLLLYAVSLRKTLSIVAVLFIGFAGFSAYRAWAGYESCGCFGAVKVYPLWTLILDVVVASVAAIASWHTPANSDGTASVRRAFLVYALLGIASVAWIAGRGPIKATEGFGVQQGGLVLLEPETWLGKAIPVAEHLVPRQELASGSWILLFFHHDCPDCQAALPKYEALAQRLEGEKDVRRVLLVEVPPYGADAWQGEHAAMARLPDGVDWFVEAPVEVRIDVGLVTNASLELPAIEE